MKKNREHSRDDLTLKMSPHFDHIIRKPALLDIELLIGETAYRSKLIDS
jgi:hypothetical protein